MLQEYCPTVEATDSLPPMGSNSDDWFSHDCITNTTKIHEIKENFMKSPGKGLY